MSDFGYSKITDGYYGYPVAMTPLYHPSGVSKYYGYPDMGNGMQSGVYLPIDSMVYAPPEQFYYGFDGINMSNTTFIDPVKPEKSGGGDDSYQYGEVSTCATTPTLSASALPEMPNDAFDLAGATCQTLTEEQCNNNGGYQFSGYYNLPIFPNYYMAENTMENMMDCNGQMAENSTPKYSTSMMTNSEEASILDIAQEITANVQHLPAKDMNGKYSLDKNHPIHCVWRDLNRGHCSWRCRWWEDGRRLSKNFNVKRFGDAEAMRMAITMKIRNSTPAERLQLLKEQREAVRNHLELLRQNGDQQQGEFAITPTPQPLVRMSSFSKRQAKTLSNTKRIQRENWSRLSWTYVKVPDHKVDETSVICRLCAKTTRCSRSRNLQQAHIMHLIRMHKNPWKQYILVAGLTKMCRAAIEALYDQQGFTNSSGWKLRPGTKRPESVFLD
ncbi:AP2-ERF domain [Babesia duncani]|uniref:AP2-ERF domain n=1 Tax=Babesia duncani TaxID=323732 RepID=A0AAD9UNA2_9APIC|nr:AP2-ERF domain [Babesia duncani]